MKLITISFLGLGLIPFFSACSTTCAKHVSVTSATPLKPEIHQIVVHYSRKSDSTDSFHQHWYFREKKDDSNETSFPIYNFKVTTNSEIHWTVLTNDASGNENTNSFTIIFSDTNAWTLLSSDEVWRKDISFPKVNYGAVDAVLITNAANKVEWRVSARFTNSTNIIQSKPFHYWVAVPAIRPSQPVHADTPNATPLLMPFCFDLVDSSMVWPGDTFQVINVPIK